jgi:hypothetical protein
MLSEISGPDKADFEKDFDSIGIDTPQTISYNVFG